jgi:hypothetical protein
MQKHTKRSLVTIALAAAFVALPTLAEAQAQCSASVSPEQVAAGESAVAVTITVSEPIGEVTGVQAAEGSGISLAAPSDLPRDLLSAGAAPQPIAMGDAENTWIVYLNPSQAEAGAHELTFTTALGSCTGQLTVG